MGSRRTESRTPCPPRRGEKTPSAGSPSRLPSCRGSYSTRILRAPARFGRSAESATVASGSRARGLFGLDRALFPAGLDEAAVGGGEDGALGRGVGVPDRPAGPDLGDVGARVRVADDRVGDLPALG